MENSWLQGTKDHIIPFKTYVLVFAALIVLTFITVAVSWFDFGAFNPLIAFLIASIKASLVLSIFMHLKYDGYMNRVIFGTAIFFLLLFWILSFLDVVTRIPEYWQS